MESKSSDSGFSFYKGYIERFHRVDGNYPERQTPLEHALPWAALAAEAQTSAPHFARLFQQSTGYRPHRFVISCRIDRAKQLLTETRLPLYEVGLQVGCIDQSYFTALFRKQIGMTPQAYRGATTKA